MIIPKKYIAKGRQCQITFSVPSKQATFIKKYMKQFNDKMDDNELTIEDFLASFVEDFYGAEHDKTKEQLQADKEAYQAYLEQQQRETKIREIERQQAQLEKQKQELLSAQ